MSDAVARKKPAPADKLDPKTHNDELVLRLRRTSPTDWAMDVTTTVRGKRTRVEVGPLERPRFLVRYAREIDALKDFLYPAGKPP